MTLREVNKRFIYKLDKEQFGVNELWTGLQDVDGELVGDCEDYAITLKREVAEFKDWNYYYCKLNGTGHCVLYKDGHVIDCNIRQIVTYEKYCSLFNITKFKKYHWFVVGSKIAFAKVYTLFNKGSNNE